MGAHGYKVARRPGGEHVGAVVDGDGVLCVGGSHLRDAGDGRDQAERFVDAGANVRGEQGADIGFVVPGRRVGAAEDAVDVALQAALGGRVVG